MVDVSHNQHQIRLLLDEDLFDSGHHGGCLLGVGAGADFEIDIWLGNIQFFEEHVRHLIVVVLACVDEKRIERGAVGLLAAIHSTHDGSDFHEVGPCSGYEYYLHNPISAIASDR